MNGTWRPAEEVAGALNKSVGAGVYSVSCASAGNCSAGGIYTVPAGKSLPGLEAFVVNEVNGTWGAAQEVPGTAKLNTGAGGATNVVSCASAGHCSAGGTYSDKSIASQPFVVNET